MSERRQAQFLTVVALVFVLSLVVFMISLYAQQTQVQNTININTARRDAQMIGLQRTMNELLEAQSETTATNRALGCLLQLDTDNREGPEAVACWTDQGLTPP